MSASSKIAQAVRLETVAQQRGMAQVIAIELSLAEALSMLRQMKARKV